MRTEARTVVELGSSTPSLPWHRYVLFGLIVSLGVAWDIGTKNAVFDQLGCPGRANWEWQLGEIVRFTLQTNFNHGALWGIGQGWTSLFALLSCVATVGILFFLFVMKQAQSKWVTVSLAFVLAGALGNLYDRLGWHGFVTQDGEPVRAVRDFLYFRFFETFDWAIFNFADTYLVTGAIMLVIHSFSIEQSPAAVSSPSSPEGNSGEPITASRIS